MLSFSRIVFPTDFSDHSAAIVPAVKAMAQRFGSELIVLHVMDLPTAWYGAAESAAWSVLINADGMRMQGAAALDRFIGRHFSDTRVLPRLEQGDAATQIADISEEQHASLIMMPTRGYGLFRAMLLGSVTAKVLHDVHCPVWTGVHAEEMAAHPADRWQRVLCAVDTHPDDLRLLRWAAQFASEQGLDLRLVHAVQGADATVTEETDTGLYDFLFNVARDHIAKMQTAAGTNLDVCLRAGSPGRVVREAALGHRSDLIVIGRGAMQKRLGRLRSSAYSVVREAPCPVISI